MKDKNDIIDGPGEWGPCPRWAHPFLAEITHSVHSMYRCEPYEYEWSYYASVYYRVLTHLRKGGYYPDVSWTRGWVQEPRRALKKVGP